jgi:predicted nucleotidyltransferase
MPDSIALPVEVTRALDEFVAAAADALGDQLRSVVLFGSAAEGRLRATSDVNVILVLSRFDPARVDRMREPLRLAHALIGLEVMLLQEDEIESAGEAFAVKFADIENRRRVLLGPDPFAALQVTREAMLRRVGQVLLNTKLRLRERYAMVSLREEQVARVIADAAGPLRAAAAALLRIEGRPQPTPRQALETIAQDLGPEWAAVLAGMSVAREKTRLPSGQAAPLLLRLIELTALLGERARSIA